MYVIEIVIVIVTFSLLSSLLMSHWSFEIGNKILIFNLNGRMTQRDLQSGGSLPK